MKLVVMHRKPHRVVRLIFFKQLKISRRQLLETILPYFHLSHRERLHYLHLFTLCNLFSAWKHQAKIALKSLVEQKKFGDFFKEAR